MMAITTSTSIRLKPAAPSAARACFRQPQAAVCQTFPLPSATLIDTLLRMKTAGACRWLQQNGQREPSAGNRPSSFAEGSATHSSQGNTQSAKRAQEPARRLGHRSH